jgi:hypothetical protein
MPRESATVLNRASWRSWWAVTIGHRPRVVAYRRSVRGQFGTERAKHAAGYPIAPERSVPRRADPVWAARMALPPPSRAARPAVHRGQRSARPPDLREPATPNPPASTHTGTRREPPAACLVDGGARRGRLAAWAPASLGGAAPFRPVLCSARAWAAREAAWYCATVCVSPQDGIHIWAVLSVGKDARLCCRFRGLVRRFASRPSVLPTAKGAQLGIPSCGEVHDGA